jgi:hypothetical protein
MVSAVVTMKTGWTPSTRGLGASHHIDCRSSETVTRRKTRKKTLMLTSTLKSTKGLLQPKYLTPKMMIAPLT